MARTALMFWVLSAAALGTGCNLIADSDPKPWDGHADVFPEGIETPDIPDRDDGPDAGEADVEAEALCGNGETEGEEQCDDGNLIDDDGCDSDCSWTCETEDDCGDGDPCTWDFCNDSHMCGHEPLNLTGVLSMSAGVHHTCAVLSGGAVKCWGWNDEGQLGNRTNVDSPLPVDVQGLETAALQVAAGRGHTCALLVTGDVMCWGLNDHGQLGDSSTTSSLVPVVVLDLTGSSTSISAGLNHTCVLKGSDGSVYCWGANDSGQLGIGSTEDATSAEHVTLPGMATGLSAGHKHTCAVLEDNTARCWGSNADRQLGINSTIGYQTAPQVVVSSSGVGSLSSVAGIFAGGSHTCAVVGGTYTTVYCWGDNTFGQLGDNIIDDRSVPTLVSGLESIAAMDLGSFHTCALTEDSRLYCWGMNSTGQVGVGGTTDVSSPTPVGTAETLSRVTAGGDDDGGHTCAVTITVEEALCWGRNANGELGDGTTANRLEPVNVMCN